MEKIEHHLPQQNLNDTLLSFFREKTKENLPEEARVTLASVRTGKGETPCYDTLLICAQSGVETEIHTGFLFEGDDMFQEFIILKGGEIYRGVEYTENV